MRRSGLESRIVERGQRAEEGLTAFVVEHAQCAVAPLSAQRAGSQGEPQRLGAQVEAVRVAAGIMDTANSRGPRRPGSGGGGGGAGQNGALTEKSRPMDATPLESAAAPRTDAARLELVTCSRRD